MFVPINARKLKAPPFDWRGFVLGEDSVADCCRCLSGGLAIKSRCGVMGLPEFFRHIRATLTL